MTKKLPGACTQSVSMLVPILVPVWMAEGRTGGVSVGEACTTAAVSLVSGAHRFGLWLQSFFLLSWEPCELLTVALASLSGQHVVIAAICTDPHSLLRSEAEAHRSAERVFDEYCGVLSLCKTVSQYHYNCPVPKPSRSHFRGQRHVPSIGLTGSQFPQKYVCKEEMTQDPQFSPSASTICVRQDFSPKSSGQEGGLLKTWKIIASDRRAWMDRMTEEPRPSGLREDSQKVSIQCLLWPSAPDAGDGGKIVLVLQELLIQLANSSWIECRRSRNACRKLGSASQEEARASAVRPQGLTLGLDWVVSVLVRGLDSTSEESQEQLTGSLQNCHTADGAWHSQPPPTLLLGLRVAPAWGPPALALALSAAALTVECTASGMSQSEAVVKTPGLELLHKYLGFT
ncbi:hypothetical protein QTO34_020065 [Cnephaeus nilssonii]|uniref:Uncharacterized protein n=1 Tax=Cnephaeus nilssonii TaxID=3371016 RepID=A0AA40HXY0_CNENI|nr:hypothetical protein QTO34_020065 [Eptesicus nilssonii]